MRITLLLLSTILFTFFMSCDTFDSAEQKPVYINFEEVTVLNPDGSGPESHDVRDFWIYFENESIGVFPADSYVSCLPQKDTSEILILPGIRQNGIASDAFNYVMLQPLTFNMALSGQDEYTLNPSFSYRNDAIIRFRETFELTDHVFSFDSDNNENTFMQRSTEEARSGNYSGKIVVSDTLPSAECATYQAYINVPTDGKAVYLELDYLSEANLFVGLIGYNDLNASSTPLKSYYLGLKPNEEWQKIYVNLTSELNASDLLAYRILFKADYSKSGEAETVYIDNVKFIHL